MMGSLSVKPGCTSEKEKRVNRIPNFSRTSTNMSCHSLYRADPMYNWIAKHKMDTLPVLQHSLWHKLHGLPDTHVGQHFFGAAEDRVELVRPVEHFDFAAHSRLRQTAAAEDVDGVVCDLVGGPCRERLQQADRSAEVLALLRVAHVAHLVGYALEPRLVCLDVRNHLGEPSDRVSKRF